ncbi:MAG: hypothetical protein KAT10_05100 [Sulfurimonas sp.]|nr:hypothetical protein [Sulfurimonas sp.]
MDDKIENRLRVEVEKSYYSAKRYKVEFTFAILYHEKELPVDKLSQFMRVSDYLLKIDENHYFIILPNTEHNRAFKALQNLIMYLDKYFKNNTSCIGTDTFDTSLSSTIVFNRLMQILNETKKHLHSRIENENVLNDLV